MEMNGIFLVYYLYTFLQSGRLAVSSLFISTMSSFSSNGGGGILLKSASSLLFSLFTTPSLLLGYKIFIYGDNMYLFFFLITLKKQNFSRPVFLVDYNEGR